MLDCFSGNPRRRFELRKRITKWSSMTTDELTNCGGCFPKLFQPCLTVTALLRRFINWLMNRFRRSKRDARLQPTGPTEKRAPLVEEALNRELILGEDFSLIQMSAGSTNEKNVFVSSASEDLG